MAEIRCDVEIREKGLLNLFLLKQHGEIDTGFHPDFSYSEQFRERLGKCRLRLVTLFANGVKLFRLTKAAVGIQSGF